MIDKRGYPSYQSFSSVNSTGNMQQAFLNVAAIFEV